MANRKKSAKSGFKKSAKIGFKKSAFKESSNILSVIYSFEDNDAERFIKSSEQIAASLRVKSVS